MRYSYYFEAYRLGRNLFWVLIGSSQREKCIQSVYQQEQDKIFSDVVSEIQIIIQNLRENKSSLHLQTRHSSSMPLLPDTTPIELLSKDNSPTNDPSDITPIELLSKGNPPANNSCGIPVTHPDTSLSPQEPGKHMALSKRKFLLTLGRGLICVAVGALGSNVFGQILNSLQDIRMIITNGEVATDANLEGIALSLTRSFHRTFTIDKGTDYQDAVSKFIQKKDNVLWATDFAYVLAVANYPNMLRPILQRKNRDTEDSLNYYSHILVKKSRDIHNIKDLQGKRFAYVDPASTSGYLYPRYMIQNDLQFDLPDLILIKAGSHTEALNSLLNDSVDACAVSSEYYKSRKNVEHNSTADGYLSEVYTQLLNKYKVQDTDIISLIPDATYANPIPMGPIVVSPDMSDADIDLIQTTFLNVNINVNMDQNNLTLGELGVSGFAGVGDDLYNPIRDKVKAVHINMATYWH